MFVAIGVGLGAGLGGGLVVTVVVVVVVIVVVRGGGRVWVTMGMSMLPRGVLPGKDTTLGPVLTIKKVGFTDVGGSVGSTGAAVVGTFVGAAVVGTIGAGVPSSKSEGVTVGAFVFPVSVGGSPSFVRP